MVFTLLSFANIYTMVIKHILELKRNMNYEQRSKLSVSQHMPALSRWNFEEDRQNPKGKKKEERLFVAAIFKLILCYLGAKAFPMC